MEIYIISYNNIDKYIILGLDIQTDTKFHLMKTITNIEQKY